MLFAWISVVVLLFAAHNSWAALIRAPTIFRPDEHDMHKYSAVLAATEPFRVQCEEQIRRSLSPISYAVRRLSGKTGLEVGELERDKNVAVDVALTRFEVRVQNAIRSYGMDVNKFNELSESISKQSGLRKRVLLQSYLYKLAADLEYNLLKVVPQSSQPDQRGHSSARAPHIDTRSPLNSQKSVSTQVVSIVDDSPEITRFARTLSVIEAERLRTRERLKRDLNIRELPPRMGDPELLPAMCPTIQKASKEFPSVVNGIIRQNGFHLEEFSVLQEKLAKNFLFRLNVQREIEKVNQAANVKR